MEAVLFAGAAKGAKLTFQGVQALRGTALAGKVEALAAAAKQTIANTKVPVRASIEAVADTAGGVTPVVNVETKKLGEVLQQMEARAKQVLSGGEDVPRVKPINLPAWEKLTFKVDPGQTKPHFLTGHQEGGSRLVQSQKAGGDKDVFPEWMTEKQIIDAVKAAYNKSEKIKTQNFFEGKVVTVEGQANGLKIRIHVNVDLNQIDSAYPVKGKKL